MATNQSVPSSPSIRVRSATPLTPPTFGLPCFRASKFTTASLLPRCLSAGAATVVDNAKSSDRDLTSRKAICSRYTTNDWASVNKANQRQTARVTFVAEKERADAWLSVLITDQRTRLGQSDASMKLGQRVTDIDNWRKLLAQEIQMNSDETRNLMEHIRLLENSCTNAARLLHISEQCLLLREQRIGADLVFDDVERQLRREVECIKKCQHRMQKMIEKAELQVKQNLVAFYDLDKDVRYKSHARSIDDRMRQLRNDSAGLTFHPGIETADDCRSIPDSWAKHSHENLARSQKCRASSKRLAKEAESLMRGCDNEMRSQGNCANDAFNVRIKETRSVRNNLQAQLQRTMAEINEAERAIANLQGAIADKAAPLMVAETRLGERARRLGVESCSDLPMNALQREVQEIGDSIRVLRERLKAMKASHARLTATRATLQADIEVKENSLRIDHKRCMGMRGATLVQPQSSMDA